MFCLFFENQMFSKRGVCLPRGAPENVREGAGGNYNKYNN